ncbi:DUF2971 domain-containing protein [Streptococcus oralis]|uniref:DUF2971 domain-containing protein n=1 Tax=Streptococcus oralis TaxID=1303 RepID=UPI002283B9C5|nr:DUF2971 domain-containing protein [Streptococcus oralis]MCY7063768.1 hypothetical protein [Streptococcus oralis]
MDEQKYNLEQSIAELGKLLDLSASQTDKTACEALAEKAKIIYEGHPESEDIALGYAMVLFNLSVEQVNVEELSNTTNSIKQIFEQFKQSEDIALRYARALVNLSAKQENVEERWNTVNSVKEIVDRFKQSEDIALQYAMVLVNLSVIQENVEDLLNTANEIEQIFETFKHSESIALRYAMALVNLSAKQENVEERWNTANSVKEIVDRFNQSETIALQYAKALVYMSRKQKSVKERWNTANSVKEIVDRFNQSEDIALRYAFALGYLSVKQVNVEERWNTVNSVKEIVDRFNQSEDIASLYCILLVNLSAIQENVEERINTVNSVKEIFELFKHSEDISLHYANALFNLSNLKDDIEQIENTVNIILDILKNFSSVEILNILVEILQNNPDIKLDTDKIPTTSLTKVLDKLCLNSDINTDRELLIRALKLKLASGRKLVLNTKYDILNGWIEYYKDVKDKDKLNQLIDIYRIVQEIKFKLGLKEDNKKLQFGHYTKGSTLQVMLEQGEKKEKEKKHIFSVSGKTRLYNASYMNDPEEGLIIEKVLKSNKEGKISSYFEKRNILDPSSWFLMSFTIKTDDLAMWSQYGDNAQGVCLVLKEDDFSRFTSFNDVSWRKETLLLESENKGEVAISESSSDFKSPLNKLENNDSTNSINRDETQLKSEQKDNVSKGSIDYLYRIAYVNTGKDFELEKSELFDDDEIKKLDESINHLKQKLEENLDESDPFYKNAISNCIEEIRYLFKSVDYKYENELRILRYANLDPSNDKIKIDKTSGIGKLYVERENSIQIDEVIFGPKFPNPEYVTPLLKLLDKEINYKKSTIKFR